MLQRTGLWASAGYSAGCLTARCLTASSPDNLSELLGELERQKGEMLYNDKYKDLVERWGAQSVVLHHPTNARRPFTVLQNVLADPAGLAKQTMASLGGDASVRRKPIFSQSLVSLRQWLSHASVRSTIQRLGRTTTGEARFF
jgi:hypothetical protein